MPNKTDWVKSLCLNRHKANCYQQDEETDEETDESIGPMSFNEEDKSA